MIMLLQEIQRPIIFLKYALKNISIQIRSNDSISYKTDRIGSACFIRTDIYNE